MVALGGTSKISNPLLQAGLPTSKSGTCLGCPEPHPAWLDEILLVEWKLNVGPDNIHRSLPTSNTPWFCITSKLQCQNAWGLWIIRSKSTEQAVLSSSGPSRWIFRATKQEDGSRRNLPSPPHFIASPIAISRMSFSGIMRLHKAQAEKDHSQI